MTEADRAQPAQDQQDAPTLEEFTEGIRSLETMASRLGIKAISTGHDYWPGTEAARDKYHDFLVPPAPWHTKLTLQFNTGDKLTLDCRHRLIKGGQAFPLGLRKGALLLFRAGRIG